MFQKHMMPKFKKLRYHPVQSAGWKSKARFNVVPAGRRSGKTEIFGKRKLVLRAMKGNKTADWKGFAAAPTRDQAKRIYWEDLKKLIPTQIRSKAPAESSLIISLINGSEIHILGMDKPERAEGTPWDHGVMDEYGNMKPEAWPMHVRPALSDRRGSCDFIGVPEGRNHYYDLAMDAQADMDQHPDGGNIWGYYHWLSEDILPEEEIVQAKKDLDELTYQQEYCGSFVIFTGLAYYKFDRKLHVSRCSQFYNPNAPLIFTFDFNVSPGTATIIQELTEWPLAQVPLIGQTCTSIIGEVYIPQNSNTERVCAKLVEDWGEHKGLVFCYGDATGGAKGTAKVRGSDWDLIRASLTGTFQDRISYKQRRSNPRERVRVNAVNSRLMNMLGDIHVQVDGEKAPNVVKDFEGVRILEGTAGEIDKTSDPKLTHLTDGIGYYVAEKYPVIKLQSATGY
jgi:hypothetical protein